MKLIMISIFAMLIASANTMTMTEKYEAEAEACAKQNQVLDLNMIPEVVCVDANITVNYDELAEFQAAPVW